MIALILAIQNMITERVSIDQRWIEVAERFRQNRLGVVGLGILICYVILAIVGPSLGTQSPTEVVHTNRMMAPSTTHPFGTDQYGRDVFARTMMGARQNLKVAFVVVVASTSVGVTLGLIAGYFRGYVDETISRGVDVMFAFPHIILGLVVIAVLGPGLNNAIIALSIAYIPVMTRITRGSAISVREEEYVMAAHSYAESRINIMFREMLPNMVSAVIVQATIIFAFSTLAEASLSYLGLSAQEPTITWGVMIAESQGYLELTPWASFFPGAMIMLTVLGLTFFGVGLRDALDPKTEMSAEERR